MNVPQPPSDFIAETTWLTEEEGGRRTPIGSGYRPSLGMGVFDVEHGCLMHKDCVLQFLDGEFAAPGDTASARFWMLAPEFQSGRLFPGFEFTIHEGSHLIGRGQIIEVLNAELQG